MGYTKYTFPGEKVTPLSDFIALLTLYYTCDALVVHRPLSLNPEELAQCMGYYEAVKAEFADGPLAPPGTRTAEAQRRAAYAAFKAWELENGTLVTTLRENAMAEVRRRG